MFAVRTMAPDSLKQACQRVPLRVSSFLRKVALHLYCLASLLCFCVWQPTVWKALGGLKALLANRCTEQRESTAGTSEGTGSNRRRAFIPGALSCHALLASAVTLVALSPTPSPKLGKVIQKVADLLLCLPYLCVHKVHRDTTVLTSLCAPMAALQPS